MVLKPRIKAVCPVCAADLPCHFQDPEAGTFVLTPSSQQHLDDHLNGTSNA